MQKLSVKEAIRQVFIQNPVVNPVSTVINLSRCYPCTVHTTPLLSTLVSAVINLSDCRAGHSVDLYINAAATVFAASEPASLKLKLGWNEWEIIEEVLVPVVASQAGVYVCTLKLPKLIHSVQYVIMTPDGRQV